jgi:sulfate adenylyltransferase large subunit
MLAAEPAPPVSTIEEFLAAEERKELLRFSTAGSVDDGKSTLIGRLLYDAKGLYEDQLAAVRKSKVNRSTGPIDFSLLTDGLKAEREQGITIDVAYRYFSTPRRKFIIADTPGHEQYTRNMATGASTAELTIILIDARNGVLRQSRRHAFIASLLGIPNVLVAVNKMDLAGYSEHVFEQIRSEFESFLAQLGVEEAHFIPVSALEGDNVVERSSRMPWYTGPGLLELLETVPVRRGWADGPLRFPVQYVIRPNLDFRGFAGQLASGTLERGALVMALPSGRTTRVKSIVTWEGELERAFAPMSVTVCLEDEIDLSRGDMLVPVNQPPHVSRHVEASLVWMHPEGLDPQRPYLLKHTSQQVKATITALHHRVNVTTLDKEPVQTLELNEIGVVSLETSRPLFFDTYSTNRLTGSFILIDALTNATVAAGMIHQRSEDSGERDAQSKLLDLGFDTSRVTPAERLARFKHHPATVWLTARQELAHLLERRLFDRGCVVQAISDDLDSGLLPEVTRILHTTGAVAICSVSPDAVAERDRAREYAGSERFLEFAPEQLAVSDAEAVDQVCGELERRGLIRPDERFGTGEGI